MLERLELLRQKMQLLLQVRKSAATAATAGLVAPLASLGIWSTLDDGRLALHGCLSLGGRLDRDALRHLRGLLELGEDFRLVLGRLLRGLPRLNREQVSRCLSVPVLNSRAAMCLHQNVTLIEACNA